MHTLQKLDLFRYRREGDEIESLLSGNPDSRELSSSFKMSLQAEMELFNTLRSTNDVDSAEKVLREYLNHFVFERPVYTEDSIELLIQPVYCSEALEDSAKTKLILSKLGDLSTFADKGYFENLKNQPYRLRMYVEMYLAKYLEESKVDDSVTSLKKFEMLIDIVLKYIVYADIPPISQYQSLHKSDKSILFIILWRILTLFDKVYQGIERFRRRVQFLLSFCNTRYMRFLDDLKKLLILYSLNQTIIPLLNLKDIPTMDSVCANFFPSMERFIAFFLGDTVTSTLKYQDLPQFGSWKQFVMLNFMLMNHLVAKRTHKVIRFSEGEKLQPPSLDDINTKLYPFNIVNLNDIKKKVKKLAHDVKDHKYLTLFTGFLMDNYDDNQLLKNILEDSVAQPFDDKLIIKTLLCMIFYLEGDYFKSYQLIYQVLEREKLQEKNTYVITYMATLLCLKYLDKPEEALAFAKSNLDYVARGTTNLFPLRREVLYAIAGFTYESIGKNSPLFVERMDNYAKAIDFFEKSYQENPANEEALYHLSVLNATIHNFDAAYKYIKEATKSRISNVNVYMLLILVSTAMGDYKKAGLLLEELLPNHKHPLLFVLKAFLEIENILSRQTKTLIGSIDDELKESKQDKLEEPPIEASEIKEVSQEVLSLIKASALSILNSNADDIDLPAVVSLPSKYEHQEVLDYQNLLMLAVEAFIRLKDYANAEHVLELSKLKNVQENEYLYYKGLLCELRKEYDKAKDYYDLLLLKTSNFFKAYLHLGIIHLTFEERRDFVTAKRYLEEALRYEENSEVLYYLGKLYEDQGDNLMASQYILKSLELSYRQSILPFSVLLNEFMPN